MNKLKTISYLSLILLACGISWLGGYKYYDIIKYIECPKMDVNSQPIYNSWDSITFYKHSIGYTEQKISIGEVYENSYMIHVNMILPFELMEVNDTLFFMVKNDSMYTCGNGHEDLYMRRYRHKY